MSSTITTTHGIFSGRTVESIVRRVYGREATVRYSADPNAVSRGLIVRWDGRLNAAHVLAVLWAEERR